ncbi:ankyrin repeat domain-containing protein 29 [Halyomorpha halys]|uniref:ankyrin repeat domain-containing protein 29 n=1 Tax=Halyomorpha halys TaxID=286706 RepID=UPI0006D4CDAE|nr:uncharacterized protein LOC106679397 [Halyomorpha halys]XP_014274016.1 uncharacterized protein LOC106679397 [Halyomorpha halys]
MEALFMGNLKTVRLLIDQGAPVNDKYNLGYTSLHLAAKRGHIDVVKELLEHAADLTAKNNMGNSPLILASTGGSLDIVKLLIGHGAPINDKGRFGFTALHEAILFRHVGVVKELLQHGEDVTAEHLLGAPLTLASRYDHLDIIKFLIGGGSPLNASDAIAALHEEVARRQVVIVTELLDRGADLAANTYWSSTPLMLASSQGY